MVAKVLIEHINYPARILQCVLFNLHTMRICEKPVLLPGIELCPKGQESTALTTTPILLTTQPQAILDMLI